MSEPIRLTTPLTQDKVRSLHIGDRVLISGTIYAARDAAHKRMVETLDRGEPLPVDLRDQIVYYVGPSPAKPGQAIGSAGPTTSGRMDAYAPRLMEKGLSGMIGKGNRSQAVKDAMQRYGTVYFAATGGAGALLSRCIRSYMKTGADIACISTGNFHEGNARMYTDYMLMTAAKNVTRDVSLVFDFIDRKSVV